MYRKVLDKKGEVRSDVIFRASDNAWIPCEPMNRDYQEFMAHCEKEKVTIEDLQAKE